MLNRDVLQRSALVATCAIVLAACDIAITPTGGTPRPSIDPCQPVPESVTPAPLPPSPVSVSAADAQATAIALVRDCIGPPVVISDLRASAKASAGFRTGPNDGQPVWLVQVDARVTINASPGQFYDGHWLFEVNVASGVATLIGLG